MVSERISGFVLLMACVLGCLAGCGSGARSASDLADEPDGDAVVVDSIGETEYDAGVDVVGLDVRHDGSSTDADSIVGDGLNSDLSDTPADGNSDIGRDVSADITDDVDPTEKEYAIQAAALESENTAAPVLVDRHGGWTNSPEGLKSSGATGFFRVEKIGGAWWFVTPDGNPFVSKGVTDVNFLGATLGPGPWQDVIVQKYGDESTWLTAAVERLDRWAFNTIGPWSSGSAATVRPHASVILDSAAHLTRYRPGDIVTDFWSDAFAESASKKPSERAAGYPDDPRFIGYFLDNELVWGPDWRSDRTLLQHYFSFPVDSPGRIELINHLKEFSPTVAEFNAVWETSISDWSEIDLLTPEAFKVTTVPAAEITEAFLVKAFRRYAEIAVAGVRAFDPNHMVMGCRFAAYPGDAVVRAAADYFDVISMAGYSENPPVAEIDRVWPSVDKPFLIEEFSFKAVDSGLNNILFYAPVVDTQKDRALNYRRYVESFMRRPYAVAIHWYKWMDNPPLETDILAGDNFGLMNGYDEPYADFTDFVGLVNRRIEHWHYEGTAVSSSALPGL